MKKLAYLLLLFGPVAFAQPDCTEYTSTGSASSPYIETSDPDCAICEGTGDTGPWSGAGCAGTIVSTAVAPTLSMTLAYTAVNTDDYATITIDGGGIMTITGENVGVVDDVIGPYLCDGFYGDVFITVTSTLPFTTVTLTNTGCSSGWVIACPGGEAEAGEDNSAIVCSGSVILSDLLSDDAESGGDWTDLSGTGEFNPITTEFDAGEVADGDYDFEYEVTGCGGLVDVAIITITVAEGSSAGDDNTATLCNYSGTTIDLNTLLSDADPGGTWEEITGSGSFDPISGVFDASDLPQADYEFTYTVPAEDPCPEDVANFIITVNAVPEVDAGEDVVICEDGTVTLTADNPDGALISWDLGVVDGEEFAPDATNTYTVTADNEGCTATDEVTVTVNPFPVVDAGSDVEVCEEVAVTLTADNPDGADITWDGGVTDGEAFDPPLGTTTYTVSADLAGCISTDDVDVTVNALPTAAISSDPSPAEVCAGETVTLTASGGGLAGTYDWDGGVENGVPFTPPVGDNTYTTTITDANDCQATASIIVTVNPLPVVIFEADEVLGCDPFEVTFTNLTVLEGTECIWEFGDGNTGSSCDMISNTYMEIGAYDVTLTVTTPEMCTSTTTYEDYIVVPERPKALFSFSPNPVSPENTEVSFWNNSLYSNTYEWTFGEGTANSTEVNPVYTYPETPNESYEITLIAHNNLGCSDTLVQTLLVEDYILFYVPNAFTPDGDDFNEDFKPVMTAGYDIYDYHMTIYNRYGEILFESFNAEFGWNGIYGSGLVPDGVYIWQIQFGDTETDEKHTYQGHFTLLR